MKVKIKDLKPNPFRDIKNYPINEKKVKSLMKSIGQTGFWDNILARKNNGKIEIAYGHHRLIALQRKFKLDHFVDVPIKNLDDETMIKIMANENDENWAITPKIVNETVRVTYEYLKKIFSLEKESRKTKPSIVFKGLPVPKYFKEDSENGYRTTILAKQISNWLNGNWTETRVYYSLDHLKRMGEIKIKGEEIKSEKRLDKKAIESFSSITEAQEFGRRAKGLTPNQQRKVAKKITEERDFSPEGIEYAIQEEKYKFSEKEKKERKFEDFLNDVTKKINSLKEDFKMILDYRESVDLDLEFYQKHLRKFIESLRFLDYYIQKFKKEGGE